MYHVSAQGVDERMLNVHYYYNYWDCAVFKNSVQALCVREVQFVFCCHFGLLFVLLPLTL